MSETLDPSAQHLAVLQQAFDSLGTGLHGANMATIVVQGGAKICVNSDLLLFHSPLFRTLLASLPPLSSTTASVTLSIPDTSASALLAFEALLSKGRTNKCDSKVDEVEGLAKLLGVEQMKLTGVESRSVVPPPATIVPAAMFKEVTESLTPKVEPAETLEENVGKSSAQAPNPPIARPPRPARPVPLVQGVKRKEMVTDSSEQRSEKSRREELLEMALLNSGRNLSPSSTRMSTFGPGSSPTPSHSVPKQLQGTGLTIATVPMPAGISSVTAKVVKGSSPLQKLQVQRKPPLAPKPPLTLNSNSPSQQTNIKPAVTSNLQTSLNPKQIEALLSAPSIGSPTLRQASPAGTTSTAGPVTPKGSQADFSFASSGKGENTPTSLNISLDSKRTGGADSPGCNFSLECEVCKTQAKTLSTLYSHCASHFHKRVEEKHTDLMQGLKCLLCGFTFKSKYLLTNHIGCKHGKINDILVEKGYKVLPCPINGAKQDEIQRSMISIKKERLEGDASWMEGRLTDECVPETPPAVTKKQNQHAQTLNEILAKYNKKTTGM